MTTRVNEPDRANRRQRICLRVRAINAAGAGDWSDPAVKTVP